MHRFLLPCLVAFVAVLASCGTNPPTETDAGGDAAGASNKAICLWDKAGLRDQPGTGGKYLTNVSFGETLTLTGKHQESLTEKRTYLEVTTTDGKTGWISDYLIAEHATLGAAVREVTLYKRPDMTTMEESGLQAGDVVAMLEEKDGFVSVVGRQKQKKGWIKGKEAIVSSETDVTLAVLYSRALTASGPEAQKKQLEKLAANADFKASSFMPIIEDKIQNLGTLPPIAEDQLYIVGNKVNIRTEPKTEGSSVAFQLNDGTICTVLDMSDFIEINGLRDRWYKVESDGKAGWVFGHFTSRKAD